MNLVAYVCPHEELYARLTVGDVIIQLAWTFGVKKMEVLANRKLIVLLHSYLFVIRRFYNFFLQLQTTPHNIINIYEELICNLFGKQSFNDHIVRPLYSWMSLLQ